MRIYKGEESKEIHPVDYPGWEAEGWVKDPATIYPEQPNSDTTPVALFNALPKETTAGIAAEEATETDRLSELKAMPWQELQVLSEKYNLSKPEGTPWKTFAEEILKNEQQL